MFVDFDAGVLPLVRVGAAVSVDVMSTKLFVMRYNITSLASACLLAWDTEAGSLSLHVLHRFDVFLCGQVPYRPRILHNWPDKRLVA